MFNGIGGALSSDKLLTPTGWKITSQIKPGDPIMSGTGLLDYVCENSSLGFYDIYSISLSDGRKLRAHKDQGLTVRPQFDPEWVKIPVGELSKFSNKFPGTLRLAPYLEKGLRDSFYDIHPYLMGMLMVRGSMHKRGGVRIFSVMKNLDKLLTPFLHPSVKMTKEKECWTFIIDPDFYDFPVLKFELDKLGLIGVSRFERRFPRKYFLGSFNQRLSIVHAIHDCCAKVYIEKKKTLNVTISNPGIRQDYIELIESIGGHCRIFNQGGKHDIIQTFLDPSIEPFRFPNDFVRYPEFRFTDTGIPIVGISSISDKLEISDILTSRGRSIVVDGYVSIN